MNIFNNRTVLFWSVFFLYTLSEGCLYAQRRFTLTHYTGDNGLPQNSHLGILISDCSKRMSVMLRDLLNYIKIQVYGNPMKFEEINLKALVDNELAIFKNVILLHESDFVNEVPEHLSVYSDFQMLSILVHNLIDKAAKFTQNGSIRIGAKTDKAQRVELIISNSTTGLPDEFMEMINNNEEISSTGVLVKYRKKVGMGLLIVKEVSVFRIKQATSLPVVLSASLFETILYLDRPYCL